MASTHDYEIDSRNNNIQIYIDGEFFSRSDAKISVMDSGYLLGDGVWEGIRLYNNHLIHLDQHLKRLYEGAETIQMNIGISKSENNIDMSVLEDCAREVLDKTAPRVMCVLKPLKVVITNYPEDKEDLVTAKNNPEDESTGTRELPFSRELYIEKDDFLEDPPKKFFRLSPGNEVRFKFAYYITCNDVIKDDQLLSN